MNASTIINAVETVTKNWSKQVKAEERHRAATAGRFRVGPAEVQSMYAPEFAARSAGAVLEVQGAAN